MEHVEDGTLAPPHPFVAEEAASGGLEVGNGANFDGVIVDVESVAGCLVEEDLLFPARKVGCSQSKAGVEGREAEVDA